MKQNFLYPLLAALLSGVAVALFSYFVLAPGREAAEVQFSRQALAIPNKAGIAVVSRLISALSPNTTSSSTLDDVLGNERFYDYIFQSYRLRNSGDRIYEITIRLKGFLHVEIVNGDQNETRSTDANVTVKVLPNSDLTILGIGAGTIYSDGDFGRGGEATAYYQDTVIPLVDLKVDDSNEMFAIAYLISRYAFLLFIFFALALVVWVIVPIAIIVELTVGKNIKYQVKNSRDKELAKSVRIINYIKENDPPRMEKIKKLIQAERDVSREP